MTRRTYDLQLGRTRLRVVGWTTGSGGIFRPNLSVYRHGPNGSPAGVGPKPWPRWLARANPFALVIYLPQLSWGTCYRLQRVGGFRLFRAQYRFYKRLMKEDA